MGLAFALTLTALLAAGAPQDPPAGVRAAGAAPAPLDPPGARFPIAGLRGFESHSRLTYPAQPSRAHELRAAYVFPDRVRWGISARDGAHEERRLRYLYGRHVLAVEPRQAGSVEYRAEDRDALLAAFELRRALFLYPDGFAWQGEGAARRVELANGDVLVAELGGEPPRPIAIEYRPARGEFRDSCRAVTWRVLGERAWPSAFEVWNRDTLAWRETVEAVDVDTRFLDSFFIPPDRRGVTGVVVDGVRDLDIPPTCVRRIALDKGATWDAARAAHARLAAEWAGASATPLEEWLTFEVGDDGQPTAVLLRLARLPERAPAGFELRPERIGTATSVQGLGVVSAETLGRLRARLPAGSEAGAAYVRFDGRKPAGDVVVVLPAR